MPDHNALNRREEPVARSRQDERIKGGAGQARMRTGLPGSG